MSKLDASGPGAPHIPVLLNEVLAALAPLEGARIVDGTFGAGGYSRALLEAGATVVAIDRDPIVQRYAEALIAAYPGRFQLAIDVFSRLDVVVGDAVDGVVLDLGISSMQVDESERGFSFMREGPLDMRMSPDLASAAQVVNEFEEDRLANVIFAYGEERKSRRIAKAIVTARGTKPITTTTELAQIIERVIGRRPGESHPATRTFQALRMLVNAELDHLVEGLFAAERKLEEGGRFAVVTFHSLEDRIVKRFFDPQKGEPVQSRHLPAAKVDAPRWAKVARPVKPGKTETDRNPRARSATLRTATRTAAPARPLSLRGLGAPTLGQTA